MILFHLLSTIIKTKLPTTQLFTSNFSTSFLKTKTPKSQRKKRKKKPSARNTLVQTDPNVIPHFETILHQDNHYRFITKTKSFLSKQPERIILLDEAGKLYRQLGFPRGRKIQKSILRHPLLLQTYRHTDNKMWLGFTPLMERLLLEECQIMKENEQKSLETVVKLLMMSANKRIPLSKIYHNRHLFGIPEDFRDRVDSSYSDYLRLVVEEDGKRVLELKKWVPKLAVSSLEREFMVDEEKAKRVFRFPVKHGRALELEVDDMRNLNLLNALPLVSPYSDGYKFDMWTLEAEKYRVGIIHEFLNLTLEKRAYIHNIVEFKEEFSLTQHTYQMLKKQSQTFYLAGTEMNWCVFLKNEYGEDGHLKAKDPLVLFYEKLYKYADMKELESQQGGELGSDFKDKEVGGVASQKRC